MGDLTTAAVGFVGSWRSDPGSVSSSAPAATAPYWALFMAIVPPLVFSCGLTDRIHCPAACAKGDQGNAAGKDEQVIVQPRALRCRKETGVQREPREEDRPHHDDAESRSGPTRQDSQNKRQAAQRLDDGEKPQNV